MKTRMSTVTEFGIFAIVLPLLLTVLSVGVAAWSASQPQVDRNTVQGRMVVFFGPMLPGAVVSVTCGIALLRLRKPWAVTGAIVGAALIPVGYIVGHLAATGALPINLLAAALVAGPILMITRSPAAFAELREDAAGGPGAVPPPPPWQR